MIDVGDVAPDFELPDQLGNRISLGSLLSRGEVVVYFYPADFTPVCTAEACAFRDVFDDLRGIDVQVVGISPQDESSHQRFAERHALPFPLLVDAGKGVIRAYGVNGPLGFGVRRATFLVGRDGRVRNRVVSDFFVGSHMSLVRELLEQRR
ncbi:MAG: peroxiredoxin [Gammaproteobacteria bacterium]